MPVINNKSIRKNAILNVIKQCCAILFPLITFSYASHVLGKRGIGSFSFVQSLVSYLLLIATLGIPTYAVREGAFVRDNKEKFEEFASELYSINIITTIIAYGILGALLLFWDYLASFKVILLISSCTLLLTAVGADWINSVFEDFQYLAIRYIIIQFLALFLLFIFVKSEKDLVNYTIISLIASAGGEVLNIFYVKKYVTLKFSCRLNIKNHLLPLLILFGGNLAVIVYVNSDISMVTVMLGEESAGIYAAATKVYQGIKHLVYAIVTVTIPRFSYFVAHKKIKERDQLINKTMEYLSIFIFPMIIGLFFEGNNILYIFAGKNFCEGSDALKILSFAIFFAVVSNIFNNAVLLPHKKEKIILYVTLVAGISNVMLNLFIIPRLDITGAAITTLIAEVINAGGAFFYSIKSVKFTINGKNLFSEIIGTVVVAVVCIFVESLRIRIISRLFISIIISSLLYLLTLLFLKNKIIMEILRDIRVRLNI